MWRRSVPVVESTTIGARTANKLCLTLTYSWFLQYLGTVELVSLETLSWERSNGHVYFIAETGLLSEAPDTCKRKAFRSYPVILESSEEWTDTKVGDDSYLYNTLLVLWALTLLSFSNDLHYLTDYFGFSV